MNPIHDDQKRMAMKRGLRMAAKVAAVAGVLAAATGPAVASEPAEPAAASATTTPAAHADLAHHLRIGGAKGCGCAPCWGPPAPPEMSWLEPHDTGARA